MQHPSLSKLAAPLLALLLSSSCIQNVGQGPDLAECSLPPDGAHTFGEVGIGSCLAAPADIQFIQDGDKTWLAVTNSDAYVNFDSGSVLLIDWSSIDFTKPRNRMHEISTQALRTPRYVAGIAYVDDRPDGTKLLLVPSRFSEGATTRSARDDLLVFDVTDPTAIVPWAEGPTVELEDDPHHVVVHGDRAWVFNITDHSVSVLDTHATPLAEVQVSGAAKVVEHGFVDGDNSGSVGELGFWAISTDNLSLDDLWQLTWIDPGFRLWVPTTEGVQRYGTAGDRLIEAPTGPDLERSDGAFAEPITDPFIFPGANGEARMFFGSGGNLFSATSSDSVSNWGVDQSVVLRGAASGEPDHLLAGPCIYGTSEALVLVFDGRSEQGQDASIFLATSADGTFFDRAGAVLQPPEGISYQMPYVRPDTFTAGYRMWLTVREGGSYHLALSESPDGLSWSEPTALTGLDNDHAAGASVVWMHGRYFMWYTSRADADEAWSVSRAWSSDGLTWHDATVVQTIADATDLNSPPRSGQLTDTSAGFRVNARDQGEFSALASSGVAYSALQKAGLTFQVATGHHVGTGAFDEQSVNGLAPSSAAIVDGRELLYATTYGEDGAQRIAALDVVDGQPTPLQGELLPLSDDLVNTSDPVIFGVDGAWTLYFSAIDANGLRTMRRATSTDGLSWTLDANPVLEGLDSWARSGTWPGSVQDLGDGQLRLWFWASDSSRTRIGSAISSDGGATFTLEPGGEDPWQFGPGLPGSVDDSGVSTPRVFDVDGTTWMAYTAYDGAEHSIGLAQLTGVTGATGPWDRRIKASGSSVSWFAGTPLSFSHFGVESPVIRVQDEGLVVWYAGQDGDVAQMNGKRRVGRAAGDTAALFPEQTFPTPGDVLSFSTTRANRGHSVIELQQSVDEFSTDGIGGSNMRYDVERGMLYITSKLANTVYMVDVRDDSTREFDDTNVNDLEALLRIRTIDGGFGFRDALSPPGSDLLYVTARRPDAVLVFDLSDVPDDDRKQVYEEQAAYSFGLRRITYDAGAESFADQGSAGGSGMALRSVDGQNHLFVSHFRDNSVSVFDLDRGAYGAEVAYIPYVGENPHVVRISPDGNYAVVANYLGDVDEGLVSATLAVIDANPDSPTFLQVVTWIANK